MNLRIAAVKIAACVAVGVLLSASGSTAAMTCPEGSRDVLKVVRWSISAPASESFAATVTVDSINGKIISLTRGRVYFSDELGAAIGSTEIDPDEVIIPKVGATTWFDARTFPRLRSVKPKHVGAVACVTGVVYSDGTKEMF
ncbi:MULTISPECIES: hypothetical protein [unclassified Ensifer]|uniref:hypothetical protein n=1 Tax=unclassified Ensifer TaxID=2633371 RepID=UPI000813A04E|nr:MULTISPECIES: hypothetical protein [unclassified Ensifer]OCP04998.1 hypothetical protein BC362_14660 [Ensifer sp. LC14]OCP11843.1 hypothetical protein BC374_16345 [Ensifer sp. LC13]OCP12400.1 hypothetical protein BBX50_16545 [Ensifer sp. LC11]OCP33633.1 hypothetical protein BC364_15300 [Ensifer sp. LC499]